MVDFAEFKEKASKILDIKMASYKEKRIERRTKSLMKRHKIKDFDQCILRLEDDLKFRAAYLNHFTINTSEFFRNPRTYKYLREKILPELLKKEKKINIWSAPCSNGSEPYTVAIILSELNVDPKRYNILASDLDPDILDDAKRGIYNDNSVKNVPKKILKKYFKKNNENINKYELVKSIKNKVEFEQKDLINARFNKKNWDLIISRNFFIYLTKKSKENMVRKFANSLKDNRYFFIGSTEFIFGSEKFNLKKEELSFYIKTNH